MRRAVVTAVLLGATVARADTLRRPIVGISAEERFDSAAAIGGESEVMSKLSPEAGYELKAENLKLDASYALDMIHHVRASNFTLDHRAKLDYAGRPIERLELHANGSFYRVEDMSSLPRFGIAQVRAPALWSSAELAVDWKLSHTAAAQVAYHLEAAKIYAYNYRIGTSHTAWGWLKNGFTHRLVLGVRSRAQLFLAGSDRYANTLSATGTARYQLTRHSFAELEGGPLLYRSVRDGNAWLPRFAGQIAYEARGFTFGVVGGHDILGAAGYASAVWADFVQLAFTYRFSLTVNGYIGGGYFRNGLAPRSAMDADGANGGAGLEWKFSPGFVAATTYDHIAQFGGGGLGLQRDIVSLRLSYRTPAP